MIGAFFEDQSGFKKMVFMRITFTILLIVATGIFISQFNKNYNENQRLLSMYNAQENWLKEFDSKAAEDLEKQILKPILAKDLELIQNEQLNILKQHGVKTVSVRQDSAQTVSNMKNLKYIRYSINLESSWENIAAALNHFERSHLVVITGLNMEPIGEIIKTSLEYNIYYL